MSSSPSTQATRPAITMDDPAPVVREAQRQNSQAAADYAAARQIWSKRLFLAQCAITALLFCKWLIYHSVTLTIFMSIVTFAILTFLQLFTGIFVHGPKRRMDAAQTDLTSKVQAEVKHYLAQLRHGRYQWIRRSGEYLAIFPDTHFLYHFGSASRRRHMLIEAKPAIQQIRITTRSQSREISTSSTQHKRRLMVAPTSHIGVLGKGRSTTTTTTETIVTTSHDLDIQVQPEPGTEPFWISIAFEDDLQTAENWKLMVNQLRA